MRTNAGLQLSQEVRDLGLGPIYRTNELSPHHAVAVDDIRLRKLKGTVEIVAFLSWIADGQQIHVVILQELVVGILVHVHADPNHSDAFGLHPALHLNQRRHLLNAGWAPCSPEVEHYDLTAEIAELYAAIGVLNGEIRGGRPNPRRPRTAVAAGKAEQRDAGKEKGREMGWVAHPAIIMVPIWKSGALALGSGD